MLDFGKLLPDLWRQFLVVVSCHYDMIFNYFPKFDTIRKDNEK